MKTFLLPLFLLLPAIAVVAQDPQPIQVKMKDGQTDRVVPLGLAGETARYRVFVLGGEMTVTRSLAEFTPLSAFHFESALVAPKTFEQHFALAKKAAAMDLMPQAGAAARKAIGLVQGKPGGEPKVAEVRGWAAATLEAKVLAAVAAKDLATARHWLGILSSRLADQRSEAQLEQLADQVDALAQATSAAKDAKTQAGLDAKTRDSVQKKLKPILEKIEKGDKLQKSGLAQSGTASKSASLCEQSIEAYKAAWQALQELTKAATGDPGLDQQLAAIATRLHDSAIRSALHASNMLMVRSDYKGALEWTAKILKFDPDNAEAKELARTIELAEAASSDDWGWQWKAVGGGGTVSPRNQ